MASRDQWLQTLRPLCEGVDEDVLQDFVSRMDEDYFECFQPAEIAHHVRLAGRLDPDHPCQIAIDGRTDALLDIVVVAYDYFSEFATICGLLSAFGLDVQEGRIYTFAEADTAPVPTGRNGVFRRRRPKGRAGLGRKKIVDHFRVRSMSGTPFTITRQNRFVEELTGMLRLLDANRFQEVRNHVNRLLVETLSRSRGAFTGLLHPVEIRFDNEQSPAYTVMDIRSTDTPAFLYAFANALAMRGLYIQKASFGHVNGELHDRFYVRGRHGHRINEPAEQQELRLTATFIKQFTHFLTWAPDPAKAIDSFDQFLDRILEDGRDGKALEFLKEKKALGLLARLLGTSDFLWEDFLRRQHANLLPVLEQYRQTALFRPREILRRELRRRIARAHTYDQRKRTLNQFKDQEMFRIDMKHLLDQASTLPDFSLALTHLAEVVVDQAAHDCRSMLSRLHGSPRLASGKPCPFAIFGLGKFGGQELGYASDIEVLFIYGGAGETRGRRPLDNSEWFERMVQEILQWIEAKEEGIFRLDVRLRPHGGKGLLANTLDEFRTYYSPAGLSAPFERQALIKLRFVAGDETVGRQVEAHREAFVHSGHQWDLATALDLRQRQIKELVEPGQTNVKYSPGGLIEVEYTVQYLQLTHGHALPALRTPNTLAALSALGATGVLTTDEASGLRETYLFLRGLIDALRIVRGNAKDLVLPPTDSDAFIFLSRRMGYTAQRWEDGAVRLAADIAGHMGRTRDLFNRKFGNILPATRSGAHPG
jgi:glutamate-ammonia-ligase adenylyltransferase